MSDDSLPSFDIGGMYSDRSKAPYNQVQKLKIQKDNMKPNDPEKAVEIRKQLNNYSYDARLKNLQKSLVSANKLDNNIRKEIEDDDKSSVNSEIALQNIDELEPQIDL